MAIIGAEETLESRSASGEIGRGHEYTRSFLVRTDGPNEHPLLIVRATPVRVYNTFPGDATCIAKRFEVTPRGDSGTLFSVIWHYSPPDPAKGEDGREAPKDDGSTTLATFKLPPKVWSGGTQNRQAPKTHDTSGKPITNSAHQPLKGIVVDEAMRQYTLVMPVKDFNTWRTTYAGAVNKVNNATWAGQSKGMWRCISQKWQPVSENVNGFTFRYLSLTVDFLYSPDGWRARPFDVGIIIPVDASGNPNASGPNFAQAQDSTGATVTEPVPLMADGTPAPYMAPDYPKVIRGGLGADVYYDADFTALFGEPF